MSNTIWHHLNFSNDIHTHTQRHTHTHTHTYHLWQCISNINSKLQLHLGDIMNKQWFTAAAFITKTWLKWRTPLASGGLMIPHCLLLFTMAEGTSLSSSPGCLRSPNEASLITRHSQTVRSYSAPGHGIWKRHRPPDARVYPWHRWVDSLACMMMMLMSTCVRLCDKLTYVTGHS